MRFIILILVVFLEGGVLAGNVSNENFVNESVLVFENVSNETVLVFENVSNETIEVFEEEDLVFGVLSFLEGGVYSLDWFEFLLDSFSGEGSEYSSDLFWDEMSSPDLEGEGALYSASVGGFGLLSVPLVYSGSSVVEEVVEDAGEVVSSSKVGGTGLYFEEELSDNISDFEEELPERLFDIRMNLESEVLESSGDLVVVVVYESFGDIPTLVNLTFEVFDVNGNLVYSRDDSVVVEVEEIRRYTFEDLDLEEGNYEFVFTTLYNVDAEDEFRVGFVVGGESWVWDNWYWILGGILSVGILVLVLKMFIKGKRR